MKVDLYIIFFLNSSYYKDEAQLSLNSNEDEMVVDVPIDTLPELPALSRNDQPRSVEGNNIKFV